jgi:hypothetical protein
MATGVRDRLSTAVTGPDTSLLLWPWSYRISGALLSSPAVELYEAGSLVDVVSSTRLDVPVLRGARSLRIAGSRHVVAWGRLPLTQGELTVEFSAGRLRVSRHAVAPVRLTSWCWMAVTCGRYDAVTVSVSSTTVRQRLRRASCP